MSSILEQARTLRGQQGARTALALGVASVWLVLLGVVAVIAVSGDDDGTTVDAGDLVAGPRSDTDDDPAAPGTVPGLGDAGGDSTGAGDPAAPGDPVAPAPGSAPAPELGDGTGGTGGDGTGGTGGSGTGGNGGTDGGPAPAPPPQSAGDRTGVSDTEIKVGLHAPITFSGVPLNLAEDPIKGVETYTKFINDNGGIHGRKIVLDIQDDRFDSEGARNSAQVLINDNKNFMISGTLGIDQVAIVAAEAAKRGVPYTAAGGNENNPIPGMYQLAANYTTHALQLADFMAQEDKYKDLRVGILVSDSQYIKPVAADFKRRLEANGMVVSTTVTNQKPAENPDYNGYILEFRRTNTEVVVPLTDPLTTQQIVQRCAAGAACGWTYSFSNFAHDSDTAAALMTPTWAQDQVRGLSSACYYMAPEVEGPNCGRMKTAREQWIAAHGEDDWVENGSGGASGYQIVSFIKGALTAPGSDLTRERFWGAWNAYNGYDDLISGPITFAGSPNTMNGANQMTVLEVQSNNKFKMITPGLVDGF